MLKIVVYTDGGSRGNPGMAGAGVHITDDKGVTIKKASKALGETTNNEAEYQAVILGLDTLKKLYGKPARTELGGEKFEVEVRLDSELVQKQLTGVYQIKEERLWPYFMKIWNAKVADFPNLTFKYIPREQNSVADGLANEAMDEQGNKKGLFWDIDTTLLLWYAIGSLISHSANIFRFRLWG